MTGNVDGTIVEVGYIDDAERRASSDRHYRLVSPPPRPSAVTSRLRSSQTFPKVHTRTKRYCSFIQYGLSHYQHKIK